MRFLLYVYHHLQFHFIYSANINFQKIFYDINELSKIIQGKTKKIVFCSSYKLPRFIIPRSLNQTSFFRRTNLNKDNATPKASIRSSRKLKENSGVTLNLSLIAEFISLGSVSSFCGSCGNTTNRFCRTEYIRSTSMFSLDGLSKRKSLRGYAPSIFHHASVDDKFLMKRFSFQYQRFPRFPHIFTYNNHQNFQPPSIS